MQRLKRLLVIAGLQLFSTICVAQSSIDITGVSRALRTFEYDKAIGLVDSLLSNRDSVSDAQWRQLMLQKARCQKRLLRYDQAAQTLESALSPDSFDVELMGELADCFAQSGQNEAALMLYASLWSIQPDNAFFGIKQTSINYRLKDYRGCIASGRKLCSVDSIPAVLNMVAASFTQLGKRDSAVVWYKKSMALNSLNVNTVNGLSEVYLAKNRFDSVITITKEYLKEEPDNVAIQSVLGLAQYLHEDYMDAVNTFYPQVEAGVASFATYFYLGRSYMALEQYRKADGFFQQAWQIDSSDVNLVFNLAYTQTKLGSPLEPTLQLYDRALSMLQPDSTLLYKIHLGRAQACFNAKQYRPAVSSFEKAYAYKSTHKSILYYLGNCFEQLKEYKLSLRYYEQYQKTVAPTSDAYEHVQQAIDYVQEKLFMEAG